MLAALLAGPAMAQSAETSGAFWPAVDVHYSLAPNLKLLAFGELQTDEDFPCRQVNFGASLTYQWIRFTRPHRESIDSDKENVLVTNAGYEHLETIRSGADKGVSRGADVLGARRTCPSGRSAERP